MKIKIYVDEAGRGPLAGPVYVGIFLALENIESSSFKDSKSLTEKEREKAYETITELESSGRIITSRGVSTNKEIDKYGISKSINLAICRGVFDLLGKYYHKIKNSLNTNIGENIILQIEIENLLTKKGVTYNTIKELIEKLSLINKIDLIIDGNTDFGLKKDIGISPILIVDGDAKVPYIGAASIIAKVERDLFMKGISKKYPKYGFEKHKGYGSKSHKQAIQNYGLSKIHRTSFANKTLGLENTRNYSPVKTIFSSNNSKLDSSSLKLTKPRLLIHICCAPDLAWPLRFLKDQFKLVLFWYNPNIHPITEHTKRYDEYIKLIGLEEGDYEIIDEKYDPKSFFDYLYKDQERIGTDEKDYSVFQRKMAQYEEFSKRCDSCYYMRLEKPAEFAVKYGIPYFTSTLLISPKKDLEKLYKYGIASQNKFFDKSTFLFFDFRKNGGYLKSCEITKEYGLRRQNYCGCVRTIPKTS